MAGKRAKAEPGSPPDSSLVGKTLKGLAFSETVASFFVLALVCATMVSRFDLRLLFSDTILTGGDSASWYQVLKTLAEDYLPRGRLFGFSQANFFGYLEGQHYFVLPFLSAALLGKILPLKVALKIATVVGGFALPFTLFAAAWSIAKKPRAGAFASAGGLLFLFNESYTMFGGNWLSTFAGEFCFSWALALLPLLAASALRDREEDRSGVGTGILLGIIGLCHFFVFMPAFFMPFYPAFGLLLPRRRQEGGRTMARILCSYATALMLMAFWLVPMAATRSWAQPISMIWKFSSIKEFLGQTLAWLWLPCALLFAGLALGRSRWRNAQSGRERRHGGWPGALGGAGSRLSGFFVYSLGACAFLFLCAPGMGMPDIRFVPSALIVCILGLSSLASLALDSLGLKKEPARAGRGRAPAEARDTKTRRTGGYGKICRPALVAAVGLGSCALAIQLARNSPAWFSWNYSGYEAKPQWAFLRSLGDEYPGGMEKGRLLWEKQDQKDNADFGSERGFENLWLFAGRPSTEGIHYGSSHMARASTYLQSRYSPNPADPEPERIYAQVDKASWSPSFDLVNAWGIIVHSPEIKARFDSHPDFILDKQLGKFSVYAYTGFPASYVSVLADGELSVVGEGGGGFRGDYYRFFREYELYGLPFVSSAFADPALLSMPGIQRFAGYGEYRNYALARAAMDGDSRLGSKSGLGRAVTGESLDNFRIAFTTSEPGKPHLIRVAYAPGWKSRGGEKLYPASPGFMLIVPRSSEVVLEYKRDIWEILGLSISLATLPLCIFFIRLKPGKRFPWRILLALSLAVFSSAAAILVFRTTSGYPALSRDIERARRMNLGDAAERKKALEILGRWTEERTLERFDNRLVFDAYALEARALALEGRKSRAGENLEILRAHYPHTRALPSLGLGP
ncbi:MAG TPA: hypothetical protein VIO60_02735 [Rectinemataceae bacterium]